MAAERHEGAGQASVLDGPVRCWPTDDGATLSSAVCGIGDSLRPLRCRCARLLQVLATVWVGPTASAGPVPAPVEREPSLRSSGTSPSCAAAERRARHESDLRFHPSITTGAGLVAAFAAAGCD